MIADNYVYIIYNKLDSRQTFEWLIPNSVTNSYSSIIRDKCDFAYLSILINGDKSKKMATSTYPATQAIGGNGDALKHTTWNALNCYYAGEYISSIYGFCYEADNSKNNIFDFSMDLYNNRIGRKIAKKIYQNSLDISKDNCGIVSDYIKQNYLCKGNLARIATQNGTLTYVKTSGDDINIR